MRATTNQWLIWNEVKHSKCVHLSMRKLGLTYKNELGIILCILNIETKALLACASILSSSTAWVLLCFFQQTRTTSYACPLFMWEAQRVKNRLVRLCCASHPDAVDQYLHSSALGLTAITASLIVLKSTKRSNSLKSFSRLLSLTSDLESQHILFKPVVWNASPLNQEIEVQKAK